MCLTDLKNSRKLRHQIALANGCLAMALLLQTFMHPAGAILHNALDAAEGFLIGISIVANLHAVYARKRNRENHT